MLNISPYLAAGALVAGLLLGGGGAKFWYDRVVVPDAISKTERASEARCLERVTSVAAAAKASERARQAEAGQHATSSFTQSIANAAEAALALSRQFEEDNHALAQWLAASGRSCVLDAATVERVLADDWPADR